MNHSIRQRFLRASCLTKCTVIERTGIKAQVVLWWVLCPSLCDTGINCVYSFTSQRLTRQGILLKGIDTTGITGHTNKHYDTIMTEDQTLIETFMSMLVMWNSLGFNKVWQTIGWFINLCLTRDYHTYKKASICEFARLGAVMIFLGVLWSISVPQGRKYFILVDYTSSFMPN